MSCLTVYDHLYVHVLQGQTREGFGHSKLFWVKKADLLSHLLRCSLCCVFTIMLGCKPTAVRHIFRIAVPVYQLFINFLLKAHALHHTAIYNWSVEGICVCTRILRVTVAMTVPYLIKQHKQ